MIATAFGSLFAKDCRNSKEARVCMRAKCSNGFASASGEYAQDWLDNLVGVAPTTRKGYQYKLNNLFPHMRHLRIKEILSLIHI